MRWLLASARLRAVLFEAALALAILILDPLGIESQKHRAIDETFAILTQYQDAIPPDKIAVLLIDRPSLEQWGLDWPIGYDKMSDIIHELACVQASGIFFDFSASRNERREGEDDLLAAIGGSAIGPLCKNLTKPTTPPVFFARIVGVDSPANAVLKSNGKTFLLNAGEDDALYQSGRDKFPDRQVEKSATSPAFGLMRLSPWALPRKAPRGLLALP